MDSKIIAKVYKGGKCWNGAHRDAGTVIHIVEGKEQNGFWGRKAFCGAKPGSRGNGWVQTFQEPTCAKCIKLSAK